MAKDNFDDYKNRSAQSKKAKDALKRRLFPEVFVEKELQAFEKYTENQKEYRKLAEGYLEEERAKRLDEIFRIFHSVKKIDYKHDELHRIVRSRFSSDPLNAVGSVERPPGGRFNFGKSTRYVTNYFHCLYLGDSYETSFEESFHSAEESIGDFSSFKVKATLDSYLDLTEDKPYELFFDVIKDIKLPKDFEKLAQDKGVAPMSLASSAHALKTSILSPNYKAWDTWLDRFSPSQWFGYYVQQSGINGILYPSVRKDGGVNLAVFVDNFEGSNSTVSLAKPEAWPSVPEPRKLINSDNFLEFMKIVK